MFEKSPAFDDRSIGNGKKKKNEPVQYAAWRLCSENVCSTRTPPASSSLFTRVFTLPNLFDLVANLKLLFCHSAKAASSSIVFCQASPNTKGYTKVRSRKTIPCKTPSTATSPYSKTGFVPCLAIIIQFCSARCKVQPVARPVKKAFSGGTGHNALHPLPQATKSHEDA